MQVSESNYPLSIATLTHSIIIIITHSLNHVISMADCSLDTGSLQTRAVLHRDSGGNEEYVLNGTKGTYAQY
jgi:hypothetical protein